MFHFVIKLNQPIARFYDHTLDEEAVHWPQTNQIRPDNHTILMKAFDVFY